MLMDVIIFTYGTITYNLNDHRYNHHFGICDIYDAVSIMITTSISFANNYKLNTSTNIISTHR
jgi:hypothetical protein